MNNRREFLIKSALGVGGLITVPSWLQGAPAIIKTYNKPNSNINGVKIGCITYSFRSMPVQSLEANIQYIKDAGISAVEMMGEPVEYFAGMPAPTFDRRRGFQLGWKQRSGESLTADEQAEWKELRDNKYKFPATIELEYDVPQGSDAVKEVQKCLEYCRMALSK